MSVRARQDGLMRILFLTLGVLVVALVVVLILMLVTGDTGAEDAEKEALIESGRFVSGVSVAGVDVSGMTYAQADENAQIQAKADDAVSAFTYTFTVNGKDVTYGAADLGLVSDKAQVLSDAIAFGNAGSGTDMRQQKAEAAESGVDFPLSVYADESTLLQKLQALKPEFDVAAQNATVEIPDDIRGTAEADEAAEAAAKEADQEYVLPEQYLEELDGVVFIEEVTGIEVDAAALAMLITHNINNGDYSVIDAPANITIPKIDMATLKANTKRISRYTSEFEGKTLGNEDRVTNIRLMAAVVNNTIIEFGQEWSINEAAGPRNDDTAEKVGWAYAPGISNGNYEDQVGGGVCQISSTLYNAAIRAEVDITERRAHSWPSSYIPDGMDATISTGGPDLKLFNSDLMPIYLVAYLHENHNRVTVEVFGAPLSHGYTVDFTNTLIRTIPAGRTVYHYNSPTTPDGKAIPENGQRTWVLEHNGAVWEVHKLYIDSDGDVVSRKFFSKTTYDAFTGVIYVNGPDPATVTPSPPPETTEPTA